MWTQVETWKSCTLFKADVNEFLTNPVPSVTWCFPDELIVSLERLSESCVTHDSQSASRFGVEARVAWNLNGWDDSDAQLSQGRVWYPSGMASLHHSRLSTRSPYQLYRFSGDRRVCYDNHGLFVYDSPNLFCGPPVSLRTGLVPTGLRSEPRPRTHLTSLVLVRQVCCHYGTPPPPPPPQQKLRRALAARPRVRVVQATRRIMVRVRAVCLVVRTYQGIL